jgi:hypothetical protein
MKKIIFLTILIAVGQYASAQINLKKLKNTLSGNPLSTEEVAEGLKEALTNGASKGADIVSQLDGYYKNPEIKIPFPPDVKRVEDRLRQIGLNDEVDRFIVSLNRAAEDAAREAKPIFISAIRQLTIQDAWAILRGDQDAATQYLSRTTSDNIRAVFLPIVRTALEKVNATKYYGDLINAYNKIPLVQKADPDLEGYAVQKAMDGLFIMVAKEEKNIRDNPGARTSDLLKKVFSAR